MATRRKPASAGQTRRRRAPNKADPVARALANEKFMAGVREGLESQRRGDGVRFDQLKRKNA